MSTQRSNTATRVRKTCGPAIFDTTTSVMASAAERRDKYRHDIGWTENADGTGGYDPLNVKILHDEFSNEFDWSHAFMNPRLMQASIKR